MARPFVKTAILQQSQAIVDKDGRPAAWFVRLINDNNGNVTEAINQIAQLPEIQLAIQNLDDATKAANEAAAAAQGAADDTAVANAAQQRETSLQSSYIEPASVLTATPSTITIAAHTRYYPQPSGAPVGVPVAGAAIAASGPGDVDYVSYSDPERDGGTVTYLVTAEPPTQTGDTHVVGAVQIPETGTSDGGDGPTRPGFVRPRTLQEQ